MIRTGFYAFSACFTLGGVDYRHAVFNGNCVFTAYADAIAVAVTLRLTFAFSVVEFFNCVAALRSDISKLFFGSAAVAVATDKSNLTLGSLRRYAHNSGNPDGNIVSARLAH